MLVPPCAVGNPRTEVWHKLDTPGSAPPGTLLVGDRQRGYSICSQAHIMFTSLSADRLPQTGAALPKSGASQPKWGEGGDKKCQ